jgi:hypothetical protein
MAGGVFLSSRFDQERPEIVTCRVKMSTGSRRSFQAFFDAKQDLSAGDDIMRILPI